MPSAKVLPLHYSNIKSSWSGKSTRVAVCNFSLASPGPPDPCLHFATARQSVKRGKKLLEPHIPGVSDSQGVPKNYTLHFNHNSNQRNHRRYSSRSRSSSRSSSSCRSELKHVACMWKMEKCHLGKTFLHFSHVNAMPLLFLINLLSASRLQSEKGPPSKMEQCLISCSICLFICQTDDQEIYLPFLQLP